MSVERLHKPSGFKVNVRSQFNNCPATCGHVIRIRTVEHSINLWQGLDLVGVAKHNMVELTLHDDSRTLFPDAIQMWVFQQ